MDIHKTKQLYRKLIETILVENNINTLVFLNGKSPFADKYATIHVTPSKNLKVLYKGEPLLPSMDNFYFDFTLDYARLIDMIETDLFNHFHSVEPQYFGITFNKGTSNK